MGDNQDYKTIVDPVVFLQSHYIGLFMKKHNLTPHQFLALDQEKDIIGFIRLGYEPFHLTGDDGVLDEIETYAFGTK